MESNRGYLVNLTRLSGGSEVAASRKCGFISQEIEGTAAVSYWLLAIPEEITGRVGASSIPLRCEDFRERKEAWHPLGVS